MPMLNNGKGVRGERKKKDFEMDYKRVEYGRPENSTKCSHRLMIHKIGVYKADGQCNENLAAFC